MWYADKVCLAFRTHDTKAAVASVSPDLRLSTLKPLHAQWLMQSFEVLLSDQIELVQRGWRQSGILVAHQQPANISIPTDGEPQQHDTSTALDTRTVSLVTTTSTESSSEESEISVAHQSLTSIATEGELQQHDTRTISLVTTTSTEAFSEESGISVAHQSLTSTGSIPTKGEP